MTKRTTRRPRLFIGSSSESRPVAYAIQQNLDDDADVTVWDQNVFRLTKTTIASLLARIAETDAAVFVFAGDDSLKIRGLKVMAVRDNVLFELGLFMGRLGADKTFIVMPKGDRVLHLPTDLLGVSVGRFNESRDDRNLRAALGPLCQQIRDVLAIKSTRAAKSRKRYHSPRGPLIIKTALYGLRDHRINVARKLNALVVGGRLHVYVGNQLGGDPCPNSPKDLIVEYTYKTFRGSLLVREGDDLNLPPDVAGAETADHDVKTSGGVNVPVDYNLRRAIEHAERNAIVAALVNSGGSTARAAALLGVSRSTFYQMRHRSKA